MQDLRKPRNKMVSERGREIREERRKALYTITYTYTFRTINFNVSKGNGRTEEADRGREKETANRQRCS